MLSVWEVSIIPIDEIIDVFELDIHENFGLLVHFHGHYEALFVLDDEPKLRRV